MSDAPSDALDAGRAGHLVIRGTAMRLVAYGLGSALALLSAVFLTRYLGPGDFGRYGTVFALVTIVAALSEAGMTTLGVREFATRPPEARGGIVRDLLGLRLAITCGGSVLAVAFAVASGYDRDMVLGTALAGLGMVITLYAGTLQIPLQANLVLGRVSALELLRQAATTALLLLLIVAGAGLVPLLGATVPAGLVLFAVTVVIVRGMTPIAPSWDLAAWRALLREAAAFSVATAVVTLYAYVAIVLLWIVSSEEQAGYFNASFRVFIVVVSIAGLLVTSAFPVLARAARDDAKRLAYAGQRVFDVAAAFGGFFAVVTVLGARPIIDVVAGLPEFDPAVDVLRVQGAATFASFILASLGFTLISLRLHRSLLLANLVAFVTSLVLVLTLGAADGARGAAWATLAGETVLALGYFTALMRHDPSARPSLRLLWRLALAAAAALALVLVPGVPDVVLAAMGGLVYAALAAALGAVPPELIAFVRGRRAV
jgi:O-antigen/teichoic acid export membrane protein